MGKLILIPTPIGNLGDIPLRAIETLKSVDSVLAEDTRKTGFLLKHLEIHKPLYSHHKFNEHKAIDNLVSKIKTSKSVALISDAGTPAISDPGFLLTKHCIENGVEVECLPGATALIPAIVNSGLPNDRFIFEGFLPQKKGRQKRIEALKNETRTIVFYESPHRLIKTLTQLLEFFNEERNICVSRELSKIHEENYRGSFSEAITHFSNKNIKGEIVIVVEGAK